MKFTLNTLGAPSWDLETTARRAREYGYEGVDLRLIDGEVISLESVRANRLRILRLFGADLPVSVLATSVRLATRDPEVRARTLEDGHAWIDLAEDLGVPVVRFFAARNPPELDLSSSIQAVGELLASMAEHALQAGVRIGVETHDEFASARTVASALRYAPSPSVGAVWDMWHTNRVGESPSDAIGVLLGRIINVHLKDARRDGGAWHLILLGEGDIPVRDGLRLLHAAGYNDFVSVEWEKKWHPELAEPEVAFPQHIKLLREYMADL